MGIVLFGQGRYRGIENAVNVSRFSFQDLRDFAQRAREQVIELESSVPVVQAEAEPNGGTLARRGSLPDEAPRSGPAAVALPMARPVGPATVQRTVTLAEELTANGDGVRFRQLTMVVELLSVLGAGHDSAELASEPRRVGVRGPTHFVNSVYAEAASRRGLGGMVGGALNVVV